MILVLCSITGGFHIRRSPSVYHCYYYYTGSHLFLQLLSWSNTSYVLYVLLFSFSQYLARVLLAFLQPQCRVQAVHLLERWFVFFCSSYFLLFMGYFSLMSSFIAFLTLFVTCKISTLLFYFCRLSIYSKKKKKTIYFGK